MTQTTEKQSFLAAVATGLVLQAGGVCGVWFQGDFWGKMGGLIRGNLNVEDVRFALGLPAGVTVAGAFLVSWALLGSAFAGGWSPRRRAVVFWCYAAASLVAIGCAAALGAHHLWAIEPAGGPWLCPRPLE